MADEFSFFTDSDDDRAVEDILSQAMDHSILEQIAAVNCSSFSTSDNNLPSHLETRFRKLKSLPTTTTSSAGGSRFPPSKSKSLGPRSGDESNVHEPHRESRSSEQIPDLKKVSISSPSSDCLGEYSDGNRGEKKGKKSTSKAKTITNSEVPKQKSLKSRSGGGSSTSVYEKGRKSSSDSKKVSVSSPSSDCTEEHSDGILDEKKGMKSTTNTNSDVFKQKRFKSRSGGDSFTSESDSGSLSPARRSIGCLWCSPKKKKKSGFRKQGKENRALSSSSSWGNINDVEFLKTFSTKEQQKIMKKAMKHEEKINREAEKIVKWAKQASARMMEVSGLDDDDLSLSDFEHINGK